MDQITFKDNLKHHVGNDLIKKQETRFIIPNPVKGTLGDIKGRLPKKNGILCSLSGKGNCWYNTVMESFYRTLKVELIYQEKYETRIQAQRDIFEYIEIFYNRERMHSSLGYYSPEEYKKMIRVS